MTKWFCFASILSFAVITGCSGNAPPAAKPKTPGGASVDGSKYRLAIEPANAKSVIDARKSGKNNEEIVVFGRIGGSVNPWVEKRAAFSIVDNSIESCSDLPGDSCETPWDYCCRTDKLPSASALVKVVDSSGKLINVDARELLQVKELQTVVVQGKAKRDEAGNFTVLASGIYVRN